MHFYVRCCGQGPFAARHRDCAMRERVPLGCPSLESTLVPTRGGKVLGDISGNDTDSKT